jgi:hypothetical protein
MTLRRVSNVNRSELVKETPKNSEIKILDNIQRVKSTKKNYKELRQRDLNNSSALNIVSELKKAHLKRVTCYGGGEALSAMDSSGLLSHA